MSLARRSFLGGAFASLFVAPAIVSYKSIMPVKLMRWIDRPRGIRTWESWPWQVTINYDEQDPYHIDLDSIEVKSLYVPPGFDPNYHARLDDGFVQGSLVKQRAAWRPDWEESAEIMKIEDLDEVSRGTYNWVDMKDMRYAKPKVIK